MEGEEPVTSSGGSTFGIWLFLWCVFIIVFLLTFNPFLSGSIPYVNAGWPAVRTAFWLYRVDEWRARAWVSCFFHMGVAGFRASACGFATMMICMIIESQFNRPPDLTQLILAVCVIFGGGLVSVVMGWIGTFIAIRHGVRVFVISDLYRRCRGDFSRIVELPERRFSLMNPAIFVIVVEIATPLLVVWSIALLAAAIATKDPRSIGWPLPTVLFFFPATVIACLLIVGYLSKRIIANSPSECWGMAAPEPVETSINWYQSS